LNVTESAVGEPITQVPLNTPDVTASGGNGLITGGLAPEGDVAELSASAAGELPPPPPQEVSAAHRARSVNLQRKFKI
jgi:hypothetical protein